MKTPALLFLALIASFSYLFYQQVPGLNYPVFTCLLILAALYTNKHLLKNKHWCFAACFAFISSLAVAWHGTASSVFACFLSLALLAAYSIGKTLVPLAILQSGIALFISPYRMLFALVKSNSNAENSRVKKALLIALTFCVTLAFFFIYRGASPLFQEFTNGINWDFISISWVLFMLLGACLIFSFLKPHAFSFLNFFNTIPSTLLNEPNTLLPNLFSRETEYLLAKSIFYSLNALLGIVNLLDFIYLYGSKNPLQGINHAEAVHQSVALVFLSVILVIGILVYFFRGKLNFDSSTKTLKNLAFVWLIQNAVLLIASAYRNFLYIESLSLTHKRIGVFLYLLVLLVALVSTWIKIAKHKTVWYLIVVNTSALHFIICAFAFVNWELCISEYNTRRANKSEHYVDVDYLMRFSELNSPYLLAYQEKYANRLTSYQEIRLRERENTFRAKLQNYSWQSWTVDEWMMLQRLNNLKSAKP